MRPEPNDPNSFHEAAKLCKLPKAGAAPAMPSEPDRGYGAGRPENRDAMLSSLPNRLRYVLARYGRRGRFERAEDLFPQVHLLATRQRKSYPEIADETFWRMYEAASPYSLVHVPGFFNLYQSMRHVAANRIAGDIVECGCFLGGVAIFLGLMRRELGLTEKRIVLFDTFEGPPVGTRDVAFGRPTETTAALPRYRETAQANIARHVGTSEGYDFIEGLVEETLPHTPLGLLCLLRLDTDYYPSTRIEFETLYPKLSSGGVLIVDDYGTHQGARRATDEYLAALDKPPLLNRIDGGIWAGVKPD